MTSLPHWYSFSFQEEEDTDDEDVEQEVDDVKPSANKDSVQRVSRNALYLLSEPFLRFKVDFLLA